MPRTIRFPLSKEPSRRSAPRKWPSHALRKVQNQHSPHPVDFIADMFVAHASPVGRERPNAPAISLAAVTAGRPASSAVTPMGKERSPNGKIHLFVLTHDYCRPDRNRQLASLSSKVQAYEDVIKRLSSRFGVSDEQLVNIALAAVR